MLGSECTHVFPFLFTLRYYLFISQACARKGRSERVQHAISAPRRRQVGILGGGSSLIFFFCLPRKARRLVYLLTGSLCKLCWQIVRELGPEQEAQLRALVGGAAAGATAAGIAAANAPAAAPAANASSDVIVKEKEEKKEE